MTDRDAARARRASSRAAALGAAALTLAAGTAQAQASASPSPPLGRWTGAGLQVDWAGHPLEIAQIVVDFDGSGDGTIDYPTLGCSGVLTRVGAAENLIQYRETLKTGTDRCPSGALVSLRAAGDRWVYSWAVDSDWLKPDAMASLGLPSQPASGPDGDWVRSGVLASAPAAPAAFAPRDPAADVQARIARIEGWMVPPVLVEGEPPQKASLADEMAALHVPGLSIAVIHNGKIDWARSYGIARPDGAPVTPDTLFQAASISKPVTALTAMRLAQDHAVDLDIDVDAYLKGWTPPRDADAAGRSVTLRELLTHTAGVNVDGFRGYAQGGPIPTLDQIVRGAPPANSEPFAVTTAPRALWRYSGAGYVTIRKALEDATGQPFGELAQRLVLEPAGMSRSRFAQPLPDAEAKGAAWPYGGDGQPLKEGAHVYPELAPDGLWTTPTDLARLVIQVQQSLNAGSDALVKPETMREMMQPGGLAGWGIGWALGGTAAHPYFWHSGSNAGFKSMLFAYGEGEGVVVMTNSDRGEKLAADVVRTIAYEYGWPDFRPDQIAPVALSGQQLDRLVGRYRLGRYGLATVTRQGDQLFAETPDKPRFRLYAKSPTAWFAIDPDGFYPNPNLQFAFDLAADGTVRDLVLRRGWYDTVAPRLDEAGVKQLADALSARIAAKTETPGASQALVDYIGQLQRGQPDYAALGPGAAYITRLMLLNFSPEIRGLGKVQALQFAGIGGDGADQYAVKFENGEAKAEILRGEDGRIEQVMVLSPAFF